MTITRTETQVLISLGPDGLFDARRFLEHSSEVYECKHPLHRNSEGTHLEFSLSTYCRSVCVYFGACSAYICNLSSDRNGSRTWSNRRVS